MAAVGRFVSAGVFCVARLWLAAAPAHAEAPLCPAEFYRWMEDCSSLAGKDLTGLDRLRYLPVGQGWLTLGGEARVRIDSLYDADFSINDAPGYTSLGRRALLHADLHATPHTRVFGQLVAASEDGRRPGARAQDQDGPDVAQFFADAPAHIGEALIVARVGRQELELAGNRLVTTRDGVNIRRAFNGALLMASQGDVSIDLFHMRPVRLRDGAFDDWPDPEETFDGATIEVGSFGAYVFDRTRPNARTPEYSGGERRWSSGLQYRMRAGAWSGYAQGTVQWGRAKDGQDIRAAAAYGVATYAFDAPHDPRLIWTVAYASGDGAKGDGVIETFDPVYPNNNGFSDSLVLYQTNYVYASGQGQMRFGPADLGAGVFVVARASTADAIYGQGRPIDGTTSDGRLTTVITQANARFVLKPGTEVYAALCYAFAGDAVRDAGGKDSAYFRLQLTAEF